MISRLLVLLFTLSLCLCAASEDCAHLWIYNGSGASPVIADVGSSLTTFGCKTNQNISIIVHGWNEDSKFEWVERLAAKLLIVRGGCAVLFEYQACIDDRNYLKTLFLWTAVSETLTNLLRRVENEGFWPEDIFMYGFSLGGRIVIDAAINFGEQRLGFIDICEMANIGFDNIYKRDPKIAAKNVQCIFTSNYASSVFRNQCHQNWLMGKCGQKQVAAEDTEYLLCFITSCHTKIDSSHYLCNQFYINAFDHDFVANKAQNCRGVHIPKNFPENFKMGFMETRRSPEIQGTFVSPTSAAWPYN